eukprot:10187066-Ditylum_brightwellii.AAC.1
MQGCQDTDASVKGMNVTDLDVCTYFKFFFFFFPNLFIENVLLVQTNKNIKGNKVKLGGFMHWKGIWLLIAAVAGFKHDAFFSSKPINSFLLAPFRCNKYMPSTRFEEILSAFTFTNHERPSFKDRFGEVQQMVNAWNNHMKEYFYPSW